MGKIYFSFLQTLQKKELLFLILVLLKAEEVKAGTTMKSSSRPIIETSELSFIET